MDQLVALVVGKTGVSEQTAREMIQIVLGFVKERLPSPIDEQLDGLIEGGGVDTGDLLGGLGNLLGKR